MEDFMEIFGGCGIDGKHVSVHTFVHLRDEGGREVFAYSWGSTVKNNSFTPFRF